jgi:hypothetical protein
MRGVSTWRVTNSDVQTPLWALLIKPMKLAAPFVYKEFIEL